MAHCRSSDLNTIRDWSNVTARANARRVHAQMRDECTHKCEASAGANAKRLDAQMRGDWMRKCEATGRANARRLDAQMRGD